MDKSANVIYSVKPLKGSAFIFAISLAFAFYSAPPAARAAEAEAVTIDTNFTVYTPPVRLEKPAPTARASVVLMTGGNGLLPLEADGTINGNGNFLIRSANLFLRNGLNVMMPDAAPAYPNGLTVDDRLSASHAAELQGFINTALNRWGKPVWVVGTSNGSISAVTASGFRPALAGLRGVVLTSTVTVGLSAADQATFNLYAARTIVSALVVWHQDDHCSFSPPLVRRHCSRSSRQLTKRASLSRAAIRWPKIRANRFPSTAMPASKKRWSTKSPSPFSGTEQD